MGHIAGYHFRRSLVFCVVTASVFANSQLSALEMNQAIENCRASSGKPAYMACKQGGGTHEACFGKARAIVQSCVRSAMTAAHPKAALFSAEKLSQSPATAGKPSAAEIASDAAASLVAPPRTISDISAILDQQKPDPVQIAKLTAAADAAAPAGLKGADLADFYYKRAQARVLIGRSDALDDAELAVSNASGADYNNRGSRYEQLLMRLLRDAGQEKRANALQTKQMATFANQSKGKLFGLNFSSVLASIRSGDINKAESYAARNRSLLTEAQRWPVFPIYGMAWQALVEDSNARIEEARGLFVQAESAYHKASILYTNSMKTYAQWESRPAEGEAERFADWALALEGRTKVAQGRVGEGEADVRRALLSRLSKSGKFHADTAGILSVLVFVLQEQGRYQDAEQLQRQVISIYQGLGYGAETVQMVNSQLFLAQILNLRGQYDAAARLYDQIDVWTANWEPSRRDLVSSGLARVVVMLSQGNNDNALEIAQRTFERERRRSGDKSVNTAISRGFHAVALALKGNTQESLQAFKESLPVLLSISGSGDADSGSTAAARESRVRFVIEGYLRLLSRNPLIVPASVIEETFGYADVLRGQSVQRALQASSARSAAKDPVLAQLVRTSQDIEKQIGAAVATLNNLLTLPTSERDEQALTSTQAEIARLQANRSQALKDIARKFPSYGDLVNPPPPGPADLQKQLTGDEALLSFYFGRADSFVWVLRKEGPVQFARIDTKLGDLNAKVNKLREALEPNAPMISDIPAFDLALAYDLYATLLKPTEANWKPAKNLIVVTNGALGLLPLSLLPTEPSNIDPNDDPLFSSYRKVPWLARTHAVTLVPSISALLTLRKLPVSTASRQPMIGFGDPLFSKEQAEDAARDDRPLQVADASNVTRGVPLKRRNGPKLDGVDSMQLAQLPRLPDTAEELKSIALALEADPAKVLNLGKDASEKNVKTMNLSNFRIIAFATHGLVPGELDGLTQPALALTAPAVADSDGDGLLTMEEILALKLDADWVVLSACNTGAGTVAGAEAASGLGRAFFYAGTRALLLTNWSVHSESARELITDLFKRQADDPKLTRGVALQQAMMALVDGPGYTGADGKTEFTYAHPLFWAPYSVIGDGGAR
ncbi:MAG: Tetratricopeptide 2 repeat protein [Bradyrhizobium sp.]|nr:Tetratricopeptide 2 repeat protein [Bradyrhizobium sp.]